MALGHSSGQCSPRGWTLGHYLVLLRPWLPSWPSSWPSDWACPDLLCWAFLDSLKWTQGNWSCVPCSCPCVPRRDLQQLAEVPPHSPYLTAPNPGPREPLFVGNGHWTKTCGRGRRQRSLHGLTSVPFLTPTGAPAWGGEALTALLSSRCHPSLGKRRHLLTDQKHLGPSSVTQKSRCTHWLFRVPAHVLQPWLGCLALGWGRSTRRSAVLVSAELRALLGRSSPVVAFAQFQGVHAPITAAFRLPM